MRPHLLLPTLAALAAASLAACNTRAPEHPPAAGHHTPHFTYAGDDGPDHWSDLDSAWGACAHGLQQSPVDLVHAAAQHASPLELHDQPTTLHLVNNGHTVQDDVDPGSYMVLDGQRYDVIQFHFHAPSEHHVNGRAYAAELHVVHRSANGTLAVLGVLLSEGAANRAYQVLLDSLPAEEGPAHTFAATVNVADLLPAAHGTYRYSGSLTTPPCTEGVHWLVLETPVSLSAAQLHELTRIVHDNNRPIQPLHERAIGDVSSR